MTLAPTLLYNDECGVCRAIARWVKKSAINHAGEARIIERPIGEDPLALLQLNPRLNIWDAYATIHLVMPDGTMKLGGEAVAEVLRNIPKTRWFAWTFNLRIFGIQPFQKVLNLAYAVLADIRPLFGCESCGTPGFWVRHIRKVTRWIGALFGGDRHPKVRSTSISPKRGQTPSVS